MLTDEQAWQLNIQQHELEAAQIGYARAQEKMDRYESALNSLKENYASYSPEVQAKISSKMGDIITGYQNLKKQKEDYALAEYEAQQQITYYNELDIKQQPINQGGQRRRIIEPDITIQPEPETIIESNGNGGPIIIPTQVPESVQRMIANQSGNPYGSITEGQGMSAGEYLGNVWDGFSQTYMNPNEIVYQSNSRVPGYNLGAILGRGGTIATVAAGGLKANAPVTTTNPVTYPVSNTSRTIGSNYSPAYWNRTSSALRQTATSSPGTSTLRSLTPTETNNFWKYVATHEDMPMISTIRNFNNGLL